MIKCIFRLEEANSNWEKGYFHGYFQEGTVTSGFRVYALVHSAEQEYGIPLKLFKYEKQLKFSNFAND